MNTKEYATYTVKLVIKPVQLPVNNRADPENVNFETFVLRSLKFHTFGDLHTNKKCWKFQLDISNSLRVINTRKYNKHIAKCWECT